MSDEQNSRTISTLWRNLKRALVSTPDIQNSSSVCLECGMGVINTNNYSNTSGGQQVVLQERQLDDNPDVSVKKQRLNITTNKTGSSEEISFMEIMKNLLSCSICLEVNSYSNQCPNGHLICITCSGRLQQTSGELNCPVCRISLKHGLHRSLLAEQLTSELPAGCRFCDSIMPVKCIKKHETDECIKRTVPCKYKIFGCTWTGIQESSTEHAKYCSISNKTVEMMHDIVNENFDKDLQSLQIPLQLWRSIISKVRLQAVGSRILIRQTSLTKSLGEEFGQIIFKSSMIRVPFACCNLHGFYLEIYITKINENENEKLHYVLRSENRTKLTLNFYLASMKVNESLNLEVHDSLHFHHFESNHRDSALHEFKLVSMNCDKEVPKLGLIDSLIAEVCFISERERSEKSHGILNTNDDEESNPFMTSTSDSNVVFTLFSPGNNASRSINTSNAILSENEDTNIQNDVDPLHDEDIVITVTDNFDSVDDLSAEHRENFTTRNNHSYVAVPSIFLSPAAQVFTYTPFQIDNSLLNNTFQQTQGINRENTSYEQSVQQVLPIENPQASINDQELIRIQSITANRNSGLIMNEQTVSPDFHQMLREPLNMFFHIPSQNVVPQFTANPVTPTVIRPTNILRNVFIEPRLQLNSLPFQQLHILNNLDEINILNSNEIFPNTATTITNEETINNSFSGNNGQSDIISPDEESYISSYAYILNQSVSLPDLTSPEEVEH